MLINALPSRAPVSAKKRPLWLGIRPTEPGEYYKFRLIGCTGVGTNRKDPWVERVTHQVWEKDATTNKWKQLAFVTCPKSKYLQNEDINTEPCPICAFSKMNFGVYKESGYKDKASSEKNRKFAPRWEAAIPVYVINDPTYAGNNGKFRVITINDPKFYTTFRATVDNLRRKGIPAWNGDKGVDLYVHMAEVDNVSNEGQPNERHWKTRVWDKWGFTKVESAHPIDDITLAKVEGMGFDEEYYTTSTPEELKDFYKRYCCVSNDDIPEDDTMGVYEAPKAAAPVAKTNAVKPTPMANPAPVLAPAASNDDIPEDDAEDLVESVAPAAPAPAAAPASDASDADIDALVDGI